MCHSAGYLLRHYGERFGEEDPNAPEPAVKPESPYEDLPTTAPALRALTPLEEEQMHLSELRLTTGFHWD
ncbi:hypothetical protein HY970_03240 [Candidatus Kaiserbacteria bacterium]|nr:hypothetical protein [Candidatus Kaiserbacteria bacterium]